MQQAIKSKQALRRGCSRLEIANANVVQQPQTRHMCRNKHRMSRLGDVSMQRDERDAMGGLYLTDQMSL
jgi:hypothetical protein